MTKKNSNESITEEDIDSVLDLLILGYVFGCKSANEDLATNIEPDVSKMDKSINKRIDKKTYAERIAEYAKDNDVESINRVIDTELHRVYNEGQYDTAKAVGGVNKTWITMFDNRVRETHEVLQGVTIDIDERFYTDGDSALYPGGFERADLNCNCRCETRLSKRS